VGLAALAACVPDLGQGRYACDPQSVDDCPVGFHCLETADGFRCYSDFYTCGDGVVDPGEECDPGQYALSVSYVRQPWCPAGTGISICDHCRAWCSVCGNGVVDVYVLTSGEGGTVVAFERCDGEDLAGATCSYLGGAFSPEKYGSPRCTAACELDYSTCREQTCGDGFRDGDEDCDGTDFGWLTCASLGFTGGELACIKGCTVIDWSGCY
jgi:hypothetical protein